MKVALAYANRKRWPKFGWVREAFAKLGHECQQVSNIPQIEEADRTHDLILFEQKAQQIGRIEHIERGGGCVWAQWWFDLIERQNRVEDHPHKALLDKMDLVFCKEHSVCEKIGAMYLDQGIPDWWPSCGYAEPEFDVLVFGSTRPQYYPERFSAVRSLVKAGVKVLWIGDPGMVPEGVERLPWVKPNDLPSYMGKCLLTLCVDYVNDVKGYWSDRIWMAAGAGACIVKRGVGPAVARFGYRDDGRLVELVEYLKTDRDWCRDVGMNARRAVMARHTYTDRVRKLVEHVECFRQDKNLHALQGKKDRDREDQRRQESAENLS